MIVLDFFFYLTELNLNIFCRDNLKFDGIIYQLGNRENELTA